MPTPPTRSTAPNPAVFNQQSEAWVNTLPSRNDDANQQAIFLNNLVAPVPAMVQTAVNAANSAAASANYAGEWSTLSGAKTKPLTVSHLSFLWMLTRDVANIAATEPSTTNPDWFKLPQGFFITYTATDRTIGNFEHCIVTTGGNVVTITLPPNPEVSSICRVTGGWYSRRVKITAGTNLIMGDQMFGNEIGERHVVWLDRRNESLSFIFEGGTMGWRLTR